jgi:acetyl-CoA carboxylase carboxyltransferase component
MAFQVADSRFRHRTADSLAYGPLSWSQHIIQLCRTSLFNAEKQFMGIAGPAFVKTQTAEDITLEELSGWQLTQ